MSQVWVAVKNGKVKHPVEYFRADLQTSIPKSLLCRDNPIYVHECSKSELDLPECKRCAEIIETKAAQDQAMRET